ncbi:MAG: DUF4259 domain-containing protein [Dysgonamonadaceae bacterium]|jgi:hypothetical protein|nr:DUF4259 domain-containing protein [Dysgonamonadaceae bacterium]
MGAWGYKNFENDSALDWLNEYVSDPTESELNEIFDYVLEREEFLDSEESLIALAASEIIAAGLYSGSSDFPQEVNAAELGISISKSLIKKAIDSINKILSHKQSELRILWEESEEFQVWKHYQEILIKRLNTDNRKRKRIGGHILIDPE